jgi:hypothetical protein
MNKSLLLTVATGLLALSAPPASAQSLPSSCALSSLRGTYGWFVVATNIYFGPYSASGMESYDGRGNMKGYQLSSDGVSQSTVTYEATYTITANCIATVIYDGDTANPFTAFVAPDGSSFFWNNNFGFGGISGAKAERTTKALLIQ